MLAALTAPPPAVAAPPAAAKKAEKQAELREVRERIEELRRELAKSEGTRGTAADQLRETESAISDANRRLRELADERVAAQTELAGLEGQQRQLDRQTGAQQAQLGRLLRHQQREGESGGDALLALLAGHDPNQAARDWHYLTLLSRAKAGLIRRLADAAAEKRRLAAAARDKAGEIAGIEQRQREERQALLTRQKQRQAVLEKISGQIRAQRREIDALKRDEQRLGKLIEGLARLAAKKTRPAAKEAKGGGTRPAPVREADLGQATGAFAALRGKLRLPVKGEIAGRFGATRPEGGTTWKGLFIRAAEGSEVRAVADGRVVFADWLRGFGNLLIIDHGDDFLSVYGNNQALLREAGGAARAGEAIATAGASGGNAESGLYFELRHRGQVFDPLKWVSLR